MPPWPIFVHCAVGSELVLRHAFHNNVMNETTTKIFPYLERLLDGEEVEWKTLGEVCDYEQPTAYLVRNTNYSDQYPIPVLTAGKTFILGYTYETTGIYRASEHPTIIFDDFTTANKWVDFDFKAKSSAMKMLTSKDEKVCLLKYIFYWLNTLPADSIVGDHNRQWISNYAQKSFPVPPLRVQARIVEILDKFTQLEAQLEAELQAELEARRKQYAYYRDQLLNFLQYPPLNVNIEWKTLGEMAEIGTGSSNRQDEAENGVYPFYVRSKNILRSSTYQFDETAIIIPGEGGIGDIFHYTEGKYALHQRAYRIKVNAENELFPKFLFYYMTNAFKPFILSRCVGATATSIRKPMLTDFPIPIPPLSEQRRIVDILDRFDTLTNSISEGLPKEIALRRKQYAYYRDALLSFPRPEVSA